MRRKLSRRGFLRHAGLASLGAMAPGARGGATPFQAEGAPFEPLPVDATIPPETAFVLGIASGDPAPTGVVLWTRVNEDVWHPARALWFQVATDLAFTQIVAQGSIPGGAIGPARDHTARVDLLGLLAPNHSYYYRFIYGLVVSQVGRCRTLPHPASAPALLKFGVVNCQAFSGGYYGAYHHLAEEDVDFVLHLGDVIYEYARTDGPYPDRTVELPSGADVAVDLADFRYLYRRYRSDAFMREALARHTFIFIWDDHETADNCYWDYEADTLGVEPGHPLAGDPAALRQLKRASQQAWTEYVPARVAVDPAADHPHDYLSVWRRFRFGALLELFVTDGRTYRAGYPCGEDKLDNTLTPGCPAQGDPDRMMLGLLQRDWLIAGLTHSPALWKGWANPVPLARLLAPCPTSIRDCPSTQPAVYAKLDTWDGYLAERDQIQGALQAAGTRNVVSLTGDRHASLASYLLADYDAGGGPGGANIVGVEWTVPAISSPSANEKLAYLDPGYQLDEPTVITFNPHVRFFDGDANGYAVVTFARWFCDYAVYSVDKTHNGPDAPRALLRRLRVLADRKRIWDLGSGTGDRGSGDQPIG